MILLAIDTAGSTGGVLLARDPETGEPVEVLGSRQMHGRAFSSELIPAIGELLRSNEVALKDVDAFAAIDGPGSFTGLRVGLSAVKGLAEVTQRPVIALSRLAVMASQLSAVRADLDAGAMHAVLDAGRGEYYYGSYTDAGWVRQSEQLLTLDALAATLRSVPGELVAFESTVLDALAAFHPHRIEGAGAHASLPLALRCWRARRWTEARALDANYLRRSDAELFARSAGNPGSTAAGPQ